MTAEIAESTLEAVSATIVAVGVEGVTGLAAVTVTVVVPGVVHGSAIVRGPRSAFGSTGNDA